MRPQCDSPLARLFASPNHGERKDGLRPDMIILHYTGMPTGDAALAWLCNPVSEVSSHYFVRENGRILQLVPEARRAWHAGASSWQGLGDINSRSIGIEIVNAGHEGHGIDPVDPRRPPDVTAPDKGAGPLPAFPPAQIESVIRLVRDIAARWHIRPERILAHSDIAPRRKRDPGEAFPWPVLAENGVGHWVRPTPIRSGRFFQPGDGGAPVEALQQMLSLYGYDMPATGRYDEQTEAVVRAFQRHFRPERVDGIADFSTITTLRDLIRALPDGR
ncbi:MAG TPA: N-acetylmuramoyl-L-alanine amidase [Beijerinckiaceae bacterium]|nr:N-acetylmuramoyl-L-alanine amidase [Beijerinckiaceae bacterium]